MNHPSDTPTGPAALALPLMLATEFAAVARRSPEVRATTRSTGRKRRAARRSATVVRG
ncbi:hypothetical protein ACNPQM_25280 [Streptomyces sp. NPDC056231]|uniref:hypothetical protein n=1 Tax=unclassified Streptomyces TaxID=2593676 RepID=UPI0033FF8D3C